MSYFLGNFLLDINFQNNKLYNDMINSRVLYDHSDWSNRSENSLDFISKAINPTVRSRINIAKALKHPWFATQNDEAVIDENAQNILIRCLKYQQRHASSICRPAQKHTQSLINSLVRNIEFDENENNGKIILIFLKNLHI